MSGIYSRARYDECENDNIRTITEGPGKYNVNPELISNNRLCVSGLNPSNTRVGYISPNEIENVNLLTDIESHLLNIDLPYTKCHSGKDLISKNEKAIEAANNFMSSNVMCNDFLNPSNTRLELPVTLLREQTTSRFDFPIIDPAAWHYNGIEGTSQINNNRFGINTRLEAKDNIGKK